MNKNEVIREIGNPLGVIRGRAEILKDMLQDNEAAQANVAIIVTEIDRISEAIRSVLDSEE